MPMIATAENCNKRLGDVFVGTSRFFLLGLLRLIRRPVSNEGGLAAFSAC